ncbi:hypothetical protein VpaJT1_5 [Vibrio phage VpaJT_1]|nr:hypothetical protein VpaJT1_5 [Vibrio phage VpaJT_1]
MGPLNQLQALRRSVQQMPDEQKKRVNAARKDMSEFMERHGEEAGIAVLEQALKSAVERGDG